MIERSDDHRYRRTGSAHPQWVPGVTSITGLMPKGGLVQWAANAVAKKASEMTIVDGIDRDELYHDLRAEPDRVRDTAASLGTRVHDYAEHKLAGQDPLFADDVEPYAQQYIAGFLERYSPTPIAREFLVFGGDYGGTADLYAGIPIEVCPGNYHDRAWLESRNVVEDPCRWLIDYKTSTKPIRRSGFPYADTALQLAGLGFADIWQIDGEEHLGPYCWFNDKSGTMLETRIDHYGVLAITPIQCELIEYDVGEAEWETFRALRAIKAWKDTREKEIKA